MYPTYVCTYVHMCVNVYVCTYGMWNPKLNDFIQSSSSNQTCSSLSLKTLYAKYSGYASLYLFSTLFSGSLVMNSETFKANL